MSKPSIRCRCGHCVLRNEVLRTELWERGRGSDTVCVRYRCQRCKRMGEALIAEDQWDWALLEPPRGEFNAEERDRFADLAPITQGDVLDLHCEIEAASFPDWSQSELPPSHPTASRNARRERNEHAERGERNERSDRGERSERRDDSGHQESEPGRPDLPPESRSKS